jgi:hypothetical protein
MDAYMQFAFHAVCKDAKAPETWYVSLIESIPFYGGPEEGGWWGSDSIVVAWKEFPDREQATAASQAVHKLAAELGEQSRRAFGEQCLRELEWLEARGLDADFLPEPDGESSFHVRVSQTLPENRFGDRHYS